MEEFQTYRISAGIKYVVGHMPYTINLATNRPDIHRFGMATLEDLRRFNEAGIEHWYCTLVAIWRWTRGRHRADSG